MKNFFKGTLVSLVGIGLIAVSSISANASFTNELSPELGDLLSKDYSSTQWYLSALNAKDAWRVSKGEGVLIAVIDTGVDGTHPDLRGALVDGFEITENLEVVSISAAELTDSEMHGTHVIGSIVARDNGFGIIGVAPKSQVMSINVYAPLDAKGDTPNRAMALAIDTALENEADIISISIGGANIEAYDPDDKSEEKAELDKVLASNVMLCNKISYAVAQGVPVIIAAGNDGRGDNTQSIPSSCENAVSVTALSANGTIVDWSSFDETVDVGAPGELILSTIPVAKRKWFPYLEMSGTSMAAPIVSSIFALVKSRYPELKGQALIDLVLSRLSDSGASGNDPLYGLGSINAYNSLTGVNIPNPKVPHLYFDIRESIGNNKNAFTLSWRPPVSNTLPVLYEAKIYNRFGTLDKSYTWKSYSVRGVITIPAEWKRSFWVFLEAKYADGSVSYSEPFFWMGLPENLVNVKFTNSKIIKNEYDLFEARLDVAWDKIGLLEADAIMVSGSSDGFGSGYVLDTLEADPKSLELTTSHSFMIPEHKLYSGLKFEDTDILYEVVSATNLSNWNRAAIGETYTYVQKAKYALSIAETNDYLDTIEVKGGFNGSYVKQYCGESCDGHKVSIKYSYQTKEKGKLVWKVKTFTRSLTPAEGRVSYTSEFKLEAPHSDKVILSKILITLLDKKGQGDKSQV